MVYVCSCWCNKFILFYQFAEIKEVYPRWAQFVGAVIILMAVLPIPVILITRLILYESAREEAVNFFKRIKSDAENLVRIIVTWRSVLYTWLFCMLAIKWHVHLFRYRRGVWYPRQRQDDLDNLYGHTETPYQWELSEGSQLGDSTTGTVTFHSLNSVGFSKAKENGMNDWSII